jgi:TRAP-type C4-dicarboxylate transport system substrate-binding protein
MNTNIRKISVSSLSAAAVAMSTMSIATPATAETKLLFNLFVPVKHPFHTGMFKPWAADVEKATKGRVKVDFTTASLAPPPKQWNMVSKGIADVAMLANIFERNRLKLPPMAQLPFLGEKARDRSVGLWRTQQKFFAKANEYKGMKLLGLWTLSGANFYHGAKPILSLADLKNEKMWSIAGMPNRMMTEFGAVVVSVPGVKMFNVVSKGIVNGTTTSTYTLAAFKTMPYIKHATLIPDGLHAVTFSLLLNQKKWKRLSKADKAAITSVSGERIAVNAGRKTDLLDKKIQQVAMKKGIKFHKASPAFVKDMKAMSAHFTADWIKTAKSRGVDGKAALAYFSTQAK